jgi:hypothetical protein
MAADPHQEAAFRICLGSGWRRCIQKVAALEFTVSVGSGGKGSVWIDELRLEAREPAGPYELTPLVRASTSTPDHEPERIFDQDSGTYWESGTLAESQWLLIDFLKIREYGGAGDRLGPGEVCDRL